MALDDRQQGIREGAGLEESRLNTEFIDFLKRWGMHALTLAAVIFGGYALYGKYQARKVHQADLGFVALSAASGGLQSASPEAMRALADEHSSVLGVKLLALTEAGDAHLAIARAGVRPGSTPKEGVFAATDLLAPSERDEQLAQAQTMYDQVLSATKNDPKLALHAIGALHGLAAVAETRGQFDQAKSLYEQAASVAERSQFATVAAATRKWASNTPATASITSLPSASSIPKLPWAAAPTPEAVPGAPTPNDQPAGPSLPDTPVETPTTPPTEPTSPAPSPAPAPAPAPDSPKTGEPK